MASNRFDTSIPQTYIQQYIPLPFQQIGALGEQITQQHEAKQKELDALETELSKIKVADQVLSEGSGNDLGIKYRNTGYSQFKNQVISKYRDANTKLADDYYSGKLDRNQFAQKVNQLKSSFSEDYNKLKIAEANSAVIEGMDKIYRENKQVGQNPFLANQLASEGSRLLQNPFAVDYKGAPIGEAVDIEKVKNEYANNFQDQILKLGAGVKDKNGMIIYTDKTGVTRDRIINSVNATFDQDPILGGQTREQVKRQLLDRGIDLNSEEGSKIADNLYTQYKENFISGVVSKAEKEHPNRQIRQDWQLAKQWDWSREDKVVEDAQNLVGNAIPGSTVDILASDPQFKSLSDKGIVNVDNGGNINIDWKSVNTGKIYEIRDVSGKVVSTTPSYNKAEELYRSGKGLSITPKDVPNQSYNKELDSFVTKAAKAIGYPDNYISDLKSGKIKGQTFSNNMEKIVTAYNVLSKSKLGGVQLPSDVQEIESNKVMNSPQSYTIYDPIKHTPTGVTVNKGDKVDVGERIYIDGKSFIKGTIQRVVKPGEEPITENVLLKPQSKNSSDYYDRGIGTTQKSVVDLFVKGGEIDKEYIDKYIPGYNPKEDSKIKIDFDEDNNPLTPNKKLTVSTFAKGILSKEGGKEVSYTFVKNDNNIKEQIYVLHTPEGDLKFNDYNEFLTHADAAYYLYGRGKADATALKSKFLYERVIGAKLNSQNNLDSEENQ